MTRSRTGSYSTRVVCAAALALVAACTKGSPNKPSERIALAISAQPQSQTVAYGATAALSVTATGTPPLAYQWYIGDSGNTTKSVENATSSSYTTPGLTATASYWVRVTDAAGGINSSTATVTVSPADPPVITKQPADVTMASGGHATLTVEAAGSPPLSYQWYEWSHDILHAIDGATSATFVTPAQTDTVIYVVRVTNPKSSVDSNHVTVSIASSPSQTPPPPSAPSPTPNPPSATPTPPTNTPAPPSGPTPTPTPAPTPAPPSSLVLLEDALGCRQLYPSSNWWNQDISSAPVDPNSAAYINFIGATKSLHPDFGPPPYGIPYVGVGGTQTRVPITFVAYGSESDSGYAGLPGYPVPEEAKTQPNYIEGGVPGGGSSGDRHLLIVDRDRFVLYELYATRWNAGAGRWEAGSGAIFDLNTNNRRPDGWTSADAAGLAILPGLVRYDDVNCGEINHAFRVTVRSTNGYVWPASHSAGGAGGALPMGARLRLKASKDISGFPPDVQRIFRAMKTYGLIVADNGSDMYITGTMDVRWNNGVLNPAFGALKASDFEVVLLGWR